MPAAGIVISQAIAIRPATAQRTCAPGLPTPDPRIEPVATCVVDSAMPRWLEDKMIAAEAVSAAMPCGEVISTRPLPRVRMTRQPPTQVPARDGERASDLHPYRDGVDIVHEP